jgi:hypothetical protein
VEFNALGANNLLRTIKQSYPHFSRNYFDADATGRDKIRSLSKGRWFQKTRKHCHCDADYSAEAIPNFELDPDASGCFGKKRLSGNAPLQVIDSQF